MNITIENKDFENDGIYGILTGDNFQCHVLSHAYDSGNGNGSYIPKVAPGTYTCKRSLHRLHGMDHDFETFEVMNVPDFQGKPVTGILFHAGNYNKDSEGCFLLGKQVTFGPNGGHMITESKVTFEKFMALQAGVNTFTLTVK